MGRVALIILVFTISTCACIGQNLVPNSSFESITSCPNFASQLDNAAPWFNPGAGTPELYNACASWGSFVSVPATATGGYQQARTGDGFAGLYVFRSDVPNMREYIEVPLNAPLQAGQCYYFEMHVNQPNDHELGVDGIGAYFSQGVLQPPVNGSLMGVNAHIENDPGMMLFDTLGWMTVWGEYIAQGGEDHLVIGNFKSDANTAWSVLQLNLWYENSAYLYVDDVSLVAAFEVVELGPDTILCDGASILLDSDIPGADHLWSDGSTGQTLQVSGPGQYWVQVSSGGCSTSDTINIEFEYPPMIDLGPDLELCPDNELTLDPGAHDGIDLIWNNGSTEPTLTVNELGQYWVIASNECGISMDSLQVVKGECLDDVFIPNAFSPNGDGINDLFFPIYDPSILHVELEIYDRWGKLVHTINKEPWDGTFEGSPLPTGVYAWKLISSNKNKNRSGHLTLIR